MKADGPCGVYGGRAGGMAGTLGYFPVIRASVRMIIGSHLMMILFRKSWVITFTLIQLESERVCGRELVKFIFYY